MEWKEEARSVARDAVRGPGAAVRYRAEPGQRSVEELARRAPARIRNEADATGIALSGRVVQRRGHRGGTAFRVGRRDSGNTLPAWCGVR
jgi:hypothetical protein